MVTKITPGDVLANIVRTHLGFHIIKLVGKTERRILTISEATPSITEMLKIKEKKREVDTLISQEREKGKIKIFKNRVELLKKGLK
jgi:parvulin-like peptidyl-prolyl isomerase